jgi:hypothetical protein
MDRVHPRRQKRRQLSERLDGIGNEFMLMSLMGSHELTESHSRMGEPFGKGFLEMSDMLEYSIEYGVTLEDNLMRQVRMLEKENRRSKGRLNTLKNFSKSLQELNNLKTRMDKQLTSEFNSIFPSNPVKLRSVLSLGEFDNYLYNCIGNMKSIGHLHESGHTMKDLGNLISSAKSASRYRAILTILERLKIAERLGDVLNLLNQISQKPLEIGMERISTSKAMSKMSEITNEINKIIEKGVYVNLSQIMQSSAHLRPSAFDDLFESVGLLGDGNDFKSEYAKFWRDIHGRMGVWGFSIHKLEGWRESMVSMNREGALKDVIRQLDSALSGNIAKSRSFRTRPLDSNKSPNQQNRLKKRDLEGIQKPDYVNQIQKNPSRDLIVHDQGRMSPTLAIGIGFPALLLFFLILYFIFRRIRLFQ